MGLSQCRENHALQGLSLDEQLKQLDEEVHCELCVIDPRSGDLVQRFWWQGIVREQ
jgi:hypothetical protein